MNDKLMDDASEYIQWFEEQKRDDIGIMDQRDFDIAAIMRDYLRLRMIDQIRRNVFDVSNR